MKNVKILSIIFAVAIFLTSAVCFVPSVKVAAADEAVTEYDWNVASVDFSKVKDIASLPENLVETHQGHDKATDIATDCALQHGDTFKHLVLENGEIGFSPLQTGKIGSINYTLDEPVSTGKLVISTKYSAFTGTGGSAFNMHIHATDPLAANIKGSGNGIPGASHLFMLNVDASGKLVLTGKQMKTVSLDAGISTNLTNRQELLIVIDFEAETVTVETAGKKLDTTFEALGHDNDNLKKVCAVGYGFGYERNQGVNIPAGTGAWNTRGFVNYLKISDGTTLAEHVHEGTLVEEVPATCGAEGTKAYYTCRCEKAFEDAECTKEITNLDEWKVIPVLACTDADGDGLCDNCGARIEAEGTTAGTEGEATATGAATGDADVTGEAEEEKKDSTLIYIICIAAVVVIAVVVFVILKKKGKK